MLRTPAEFPHPGSLAFLADTAAPARIMRHNGDGTSAISLRPTREDPLLGRIASGSTTVPTSTLYATAREAERAFLAPKPQRRTRASSAGKSGGGKPPARARPRRTRQVASR